MIFLNYKKECHNSTHVPHSGVIIPKFILISLYDSTISIIVIFKALYNKAINKKKVKTKILLQYQILLRDTNNQPTHFQTLIFAPRHQFAINNNSHNNSRLLHATTKQKNATPAELQIDFRIGICAHLLGGGDDAITYHRSTHCDPAPTNDW